MRTFIVLTLALFTLVSCRDYKEVHFYVVNRTSDSIEVEYRVRQCIGNTRCLPVTRTAGIGVNDSVMLHIQDQVTHDYDIEKSFFHFELRKNGDESTYDFWNSKALTKEVFEEHILYTLTVNENFF